jgi:dTDP-4-dehydrorhamnose reductase
VKILVFGGDGMLGHQVAGRFSVANEVVATVRKPPSSEVSRALANCRIVPNVEVRISETWVQVLRDVRPDVVVNCVGIVKHRAASTDPIASIEVNSLLPHRLASACASSGARLIHISTDCVFSGERGGYSESDNPDPVDLYGRTKLVGEVSGTNCLTIRTSMIGLELANYSGLVEWFLRQNGEVRGYRRAIWSGLTTSELARVIETISRAHREIDGIWHVASAPISKFDLLEALGRHLGRRNSVVPDESVVINRSLNSERFRMATGYESPPHDVMLGELASAIREREERHVA